MDARRIKKKDKKDESIQILLNQEEKEKLIELAKAEGLPVSTFVRWKLLRKST